MIRSLFPKLFLWYLLGTSLVVGVTLAFDYFDDSDAAPESRRRMWLANIVLAQGQRAADAYQRGGVEGLNSQLAALEDNTGIRGLLFDWDGTELSGRSITEDDRELAIRAALTDDFQFGHGQSRPLVAACIEEPEHVRFVFLGQMPPGRSLDFLRRPLPFLSRLGSALLVAAGVCYGLARYLTGPIRRLREASKRLADGDLSVRVAKGAPLRRDEIGDLGRDFDYMAGRLEGLVELQKRLLRDISHELRSPLARLNVALELARQAAGPTAGEPLNRIELESDRLNQMIGQLLTLAKLEQNGVPVEQASVDLASLIGELATDAAFEARARNVQVRVRQAEPCRVRGSETLLRSAIENVVRNAVQFTSEASAVEIELKVIETGDSRVARICVRDHGPGVPEAQLSDIFRPFYRVADARERETGGTGLGLSITDRIVSSYGGTAKANQADGGGLVIQIELPLLDSAGGVQR